MAGALVPDALWNLIEPLRPILLPKPLGGRLRLTDRACLARIIFVLRSRQRSYAAEARTCLEQCYDKLKRSRKTALLVAVIKRFVEIDGLTLSGLVSIQLFTTVIPLIIIGF